MAIFCGRKFFVIDCRVFFLNQKAQLYVAAYLPFIKNDGTRGNTENGPEGILLTYSYYNLMSICTHTIMYRCEWLNILFRLAVYYLLYCKTCIFLEGNV